MNAVIIRLDTDGSTGEVDDLDDLKRLHVEVKGAGEIGETIDTFGRLDPDGEHAWLSVEALRQAAVGRVDPGWEARFDAMVAQAADHGWVDEAQAAVRAHIERV